MAHRVPERLELRRGVHDERLGSGRISDRPDITTARYVTHAPPANVPTTITSPTSGQTVSGTATVTGTTAPHATVVIASDPTDTGGATSFVSTTASASGALGSHRGTGVTDRLEL